MKRLFTRAAIAACCLVIAPLHAADVPKNLGYGLDKLVEDSLTLKANPQAPTPYDGYTTEAAASYAADAITDEATGRVLVDILPNGKISVQKMQALLEARISSLTIVATDANYRHTGILEGYVSIDDVPKLAQLTGVRSVFLSLKPEHGSVRSGGGPGPNVVPGDVLNKLGTSFDQGVTQHRVDRINQFYNPNAIVNYDGTGMSVAVISDSFNGRPVDANDPGAATDVANFDLPGDPANPVNTQPVVVLRDLPPAASDTDEGRGMAQIVYKMAPKAKVAFATGSLGEVQFAYDIRTLAAGFTQGATTFKADVIADDLSYGGEPFYGETIIGNAIDDVTAQGVSYFSSAGNNIGINAYESPLRIVPDASAGGTLLTAAAGNTALAGTNINLAGVPAGLYAGGFHNFNPNPGQLDVAQLVNMPGTITSSTEMQWDDPYDQRPPTPVTPPVFSSSGASTGGASVTFDASSSPALPQFTGGVRYVIKETATAGTFDGEIQIYDSANTLLVDQDSVVDEVVLFDAPATDQYRIVVLPCCGTEGTFDITVSNVLYATNGNSTGGSTVTFDGSSSPALPTFTAGTTYTIEETAFSADMDGIVTIKDPSNNTVVTQDTGTDEVVTFTATASGQYTIQVAPFGTTSGDFHLVVYESNAAVGVTTDLNLLAFNPSGAYISARSLTSNNLANNRPVELGIVRAAGFSQMQFVIARANIPTAPRLPTRVRWSTRGNGAANIGPAEYFTYNATTTKGHATAKGCNGTAAYSVFRPNIPEAFTSPGPATILFDKDSNLLPTPDIRQVPRVAAADAANTSSFPGPVNLNDTASDPDTNPNFSGTSAAAPHAAAIAALVLQAHGGPGSVTPAAMRTILQTNVFPHDLNPSASSGSASTSDGGTVAITINSDNDNNVATGMNDPNSFNVSYSGPGSIASLTFNPQGTAFTAGRPTSGINGVQDSVPGTVSYFENDFPGMMFRPATVISAAPAIPARGFTLGNLTGLSAADIAQPQNTSPFTGFSNPAPAPATATDFWTMSVGFPTGNFTSGKSMNFTVGRGAQRSSSLAPGGSTTLSALADLFGGGVMIPNGVTIAEGMTFSGTTTAGGTFSGTIKNNIGYGWTPVDGFGFIDAAAATGAGTTVLVASGSAAPNTTGAGTSTLLTVAVTPGSSPTSTGLYVSADLSGIGGDPSQKFYDDGTNGDLTPGDNIFSYQATVASGTTVGGRVFPAIVSDVQGRGGATQIAFTVSAFTAPTGIGSATPSSVAPGDNTLLTVQTTKGAYPTSTGMAVTVDLSSIGGSATTQFLDDGVAPDAVAGDGKFSFTANVPLATTPGGKSLPVTISDAQSRSGSTNIALTVLPGVALSGTGTATPASVQVTDSTLLEVAVTPGTGPVSSGITVTADLSSIAGSATQQFYDDGTHGDITSGDNTFSYTATVAPGSSAGGLSLPVTIGDAQSRSGTTNIALTVSPEGGLSVVAAGPPATVDVTASTVLAVIVTPGTSPASSSIVVTADLTSIGGSATQALLDDGVAPDATAGDNTYTASTTVALGTAPGSKLLPVSVSDAQSRTASMDLALTVATPTAPTATGAASPNSGIIGASSLLTVTVTGGTHPASSGTTVTVDLSSIGGSASQSFLDDGLNGDATANDGIFSFAATVGNTAIPGPHVFAVTVTDAQNRSASTSIAFNVSSPGALSGSGSASPSSVAPSGSTTLTVTPVPGTNPASTGITVKADLTSIGGSATQSFTDNGDGTFSFNANIPLNTVSGSKNLPVTIKDAQSRTGSATISLTVLASGALSATASATPNAGIVGTPLTFSVTVTAGTNPASTGISVTADLTDFGGTATQAFSGAGPYTFSAVVQNSATPGLHVIPVSITDGQGRSASASIAFNVTVEGALSGSGLAAPASVGLGDSATLLVSVIPGTNPASSGVTVTVNLSQIGGDPAQAFYDDGTHGDQHPGDGIYTFVQPIASNIALGTVLLPVTLGDAQSRSGSATIQINVTQGTEVIFANGFE